MAVAKTDLRDTRERARELRFEATGAITQTNVQKAIEQATSTPQSVPGTAVNFGMSPYVPLNTDSMLYVDTSGGAVQILLQPSAFRNGVPLSIKDVTGNAAANNITITPNGAETIDGLPSLVIGADFGGYRLNPRTLSYTLAP